MQLPSTTAKEEVVDMLRRLPDDASLEDIEYHVSIMAGVARSIRAVEAGHTVTQAEVERLMDEWPVP